MFISVFILNPPYNCYILHTQICNEVRKYADKAIAICPINKTTRYKTCEFLDKPFGNQIAWNNVFLLDLKGEENEYFSYNEMPLWDKTSNKCLWTHENPPKVYITKSDNITSKRRFKVKDTQETYDFINWINTNEIGIFYITNTRTILPSRYMINRLWEIYNDKG